MQALRFLVLLFVAVVVLGLFSVNVFALNADDVTYSFDVKFDIESLPADRKGIAQKINNSESVSFKEITRLYISDHLTQYKNGSKSKSQVDHQLLSSLTEISNGQSLLDMKLKYESKIAAESEILYNKDAITIFDFLINKKMQCFSGTSMNLAISRESASAWDYRQKNHVVVLEEGHVYPGQMVHDTNGYQLIGVETTASGEGLYTLSVSDTKNMKEGERYIVDADYYVLSQVFKAGLSAENAEKLRRELLQKTAALYSINIETVDRAIPNVKGKPAFNSSIFSFGVAEVEAGDKARNPFRNGGNAFRTSSYRQETSSYSLCDKHGLNVDIYELSNEYLYYFSSYYNYYYPSDDFCSGTYFDPKTRSCVECNHLNCAGKRLFSLEYWELVQCF